MSSQLARLCLILRAQVPTLAWIGHPRLTLAHDITTSARSADPHVHPLHRPLMHTHTLLVDYSCTRSPFSPTIHAHAHPPRRLFMHTRTLLTDLEQWHYSITVLHYWCINTHIARTHTLCTRACTHALYTRTHTHTAHTHLFTHTQCRWPSDSFAFVASLNGTVLRTICDSDGES